MHDKNGTYDGTASNFVHAYPFAGPQSFQYGNGHSFNQSRDQDYRPATAVDGPYQKTYSHDPAGNVASLTDIGNTVLSYSYDSSGRLTGATDTAAGSFGILGYSYDPNGNRLAETRNASTLPYVYSPPNWLYQKGSDTRTKTASGNTASSTAIGSFTYDGFNRLATSVTAAETTTYTYNALGERIKKINQNGLSTVFHYGPNGELLYERDANGNTKAYVWLDGRPLARIDNDAQIYYYHVDHLGTPQAMTDAAGTTVWKADYEPFGKATIKVSTIENNLRFPGQYYDRETGLHYNYYRSSYDPGTGRYGEADPIGLAGGLNIYSYAEGNPVSKIDPLGLMGSRGYIPGRSPGSTVSVFGCLIGCVSSPLDGSTGPQASMEPTLGGGFEICEKPKPRPNPNQCDKPKPKNCGIYDPNCDNQIQPPGIPVPTGIGFIVGASIKKDGRLCLRFGLFGEAPLVPSVELGDLDE